MKLYEMAHIINERMCELELGKYQKKHKIKNKKPITEVGSYCPKEKVGQAWCHTKDNTEKEEVEE